MFKLQKEYFVSCNTWACASLPYYQVCGLAQAYNIFAKRLVSNKILMDLSDIHPSCYLSYEKE
jgi:hypothetical protein